MVVLRTIPIGDLGRVVTGKTPPSSQPELFGEVHPFLTPTDINGFARYIEPARFLSPRGCDFQHRLMLPERTVCVVCIGATIGKVCMTSRPSFTNQQINSVVVNEDDHDPFFVYHLMTTLRDEMKSKAGGAATPIINKTAFSAIKVSVPALPVQQRIAEILSAYDELIENSQRRIKILDSMARALYRRWFVHFRYPGHESVPLIPSAVGDIPQGWEVKKIAEFAEFTRGFEPGSNAYKNEPGIGLVKFLRVGDLGKRDSGLFVDEHLVQGRVLKPLDIAITLDGSVGLVCIGLDGAYSSGIRRVDVKDPSRLGWIFTYQLLLSDTSQATIHAHAKGTTIMHAGSAVAALEFISPPETLITKFETMAAPMMQQVLILHAHVENLRRTRDLLLPRLLSGQIDVETIAP